MPATQPAVIGSGGLAGGGTTAPVKEKPRVVIKQIVRQEVGARKAKKRRITKGNKQALKTKKSEYTKLKRDAQKRLQQQKNDAYAAEAGRIKALPSKKRAAARKLLRVRLKKTYDDRLKQLPTVGKRSYNDIIALINKIRKLKW